MPEIWDTLGDSCPIRKYLKRHNWMRSRRVHEGEDTGPSSEPEDILTLRSWGEEQIPELYHGIVQPATREGKRK